MAYKYTSNVAKIKADNNSNIPLAIRFMLDNTHALALPKTPKDTGDLSKNVFKTVQGRRGIISWIMNYAIYQEDKQHVNYTTPGTGPHFAENSVKQTVAEADSFFRKARLY